MTLAVASEHRASVARAMERGRQPKTLAGLLHWYITAIRAETPERLHIREPWHDRVSAHEGVQPVGGSKLGSPAWSGTFRALLEGSPSAIDDEGWYRFPVRAALSRMSRRDPLMARFLFRLAQAEGDWQRLSDELDYPHAFTAVYCEAALARLWHGYHERSVGAMPRVYDVRTADR